MGHWLAFICFKYKPAEIICVKKPSYTQNPAAIVVVVAALAMISIVILMRTFPSGGQCASLQECVQYANIYGVYNAVYDDSYSSPGGTATTQKAFAVMNDQVVACNSCTQIYMSGYGNSTEACAQGWNCQDVMTQGDVLAIVRNMASPESFSLEGRQCFRGPVENFTATVCFDQTNRIVSYKEEGKRPFYSFAIES